MVILFYFWYIFSAKGLQYSCNLSFPRTNSLMETLKATALDNLHLFAPSSQLLRMQGCWAGHLCRQARKQAVRPYEVIFGEEVGSWNRNTAGNLQFFKQQWTALQAGRLVLPS